MSKVVVLGGGNGTSRLLHALKPMLESGKVESLHALVLNADDGGSTGRLRSQYGVAAMGDVTKSLVALSDFQGDTRGEQLLKALNNRFEKGDFKGHTLRNVFLAALEMASDLDAAIAMMARILQVPKEAGVVPVTLKALNQEVKICFDREDNLLGEGQHFISHNVNLQADPRWQAGDVKVSFKEQDAKLNPRAQEILSEATHILIAPGHTYGTILPVLALPALKDALKIVSAKIVTVMTLLTTPRQTTGWSGEDFVKVYESYIGRKIDTVIANTGEVEIGLVAGQDWVRFGEGEHEYELIAEELVSTEEQKATASDVVPRAIVIHEADKLKEILEGVV